MTPSRPTPDVGPLDASGRLGRIAARRDRLGEGSHPAKNSRPAVGDERPQRIGFWPMGVEVFRPRKLLWGLRAAPWFAAIPVRTYYANSSMLAINPPDARPG